MEKFYQQPKPSGDAVYWYDLLDRSSKGTDPTVPVIHKVTPGASWAATSWPFLGPLAFERS